MANNSGSRIRFITDNVRLEKGGAYNETLLNPRAGADIRRYIRGLRLNNIPVLVYCFSTIDSTTYVGRFELAGSTTRPDVMFGYIQGLIKGRDDSQDWARFRAVNSERGR